MYTYQDLEKVKDDEKSLKQFIIAAIDEFKSSDDYKMAVTAEEYYKNHNPDIMAYEKWVYDLNGMAHQDMISPNHKIPTNYFFMLVSQAVAYTLANGVSFDNESVKDKLGKNFDGVLKKILTDAIISKRSWGFYHDGKVDFIPYKRFVGLPDEFDGSIKAGIWFFQIDDKKPLTIRLYEIDGWSEYVRENGGELELKTAKRPYKIQRRESVMETEIVAGENYPTFPIVPLKNINDQSAIVGVLNILIALDMMYSKLVNNVSEGDLVYWVLKNYGGMNDIDDENFVIQMLKTHVIHIEGEGDAAPHQIDVPFEASETTIAALKRLLFDGMMGVDVERIASGNETATAIRAAYENLNIKEGLLEYEVIEFIQGIFAVAGIDENEGFHFTPNKIINQAEEVQTVASVANLLGDEAATKKVCDILGMIDSFEDIQRNKMETAMLVAQEGMDNE